MGRFRDFRDWDGEWDGVYDGRSASLATAFLQVPFDNRRAQPNLNYTEGENTWVSKPDPSYSIDAFSHRVDNQPSLDPSFGTPGRESLNWPRVFIHTWDTNFLSGISHWQGKDYGMWFRRRGTGPVPNQSPKRFTTWYALRDGHDHPHESRFNYSSGSYDGRPATLALHIDAASPRPADGARISVVFTDSAGHSWQGSRVTRSGEHWIEDLQLRSFGSPTDRLPILWPRLYLHTWNVRHCTGWSEWNSELFGFTFFDGN